VPLDYEKNFEKALLTFKFQVVYCPDQRKLIHLNDPSTHPLGPLLVNYPDLSFLGEQLDQEIAIKVCTGEIDPMTRQEFKEINEKVMKVYEKKKKEPKKLEKVNS
jgi:exonuclease 1